eukprot:14654340-Alexandrium_andersonii.AAC.1
MLSTPPNKTLRIAHCQIARFNRAWVMARKGGNMLVECKRLRQHPNIATRHTTKGHAAVTMNVQQE